MKILCFGDSNTWGDSGKKIIGRYTQRWPVALQELLPYDEIVDHSKNGRVLNDKDLEKRCFQQFASEVKKEYDVVIIALGINDTQTKYGLSGIDIVELIEKFSATAIEAGSNVVVVGPVTVELDKIPWKDDFTKETNAKVHAIYTAFPHAVDCRDLKLGLDGLHLTEKSHIKLARRIKSII